jgi:hypothetical protein
MKKFDVSWLVDAADTTIKKAELACVLASATVGELVVFSNEPLTEKKRVYLSRIKHYRELFARMKEQIDNEKEKPISTNERSN